MRTLALVLPQGYHYCRMIRRGVVEEIERQGDWQLLQLPSYESGRIPARNGMHSLHGVIAWVDRKHDWMRELAHAGIPVVNCGGDWRGVSGIATVAVDLGSVLQLAVDHFHELGLQKVYYFGHKVSTDPHRQRALQAIRQIAAQVDIEIDSLETRGKNPDENLERLLAPEKELRLIKQFAAIEGAPGLLAENDYFARLACNVAARASKRVPHDLAILGTTGDLLGRFGSPTISTVPFPGIEVGQTAFRLIREAHQGRPITPNDCNIKADTIIMRESTGGKAQDIAMERVFRHVEREALRGLTVQELPEIAQLSLKALRRRYKQVYGEEPSDHIRRLRIDRAKHLLVATADPISTIAASCGFSSQAAFYNYFLRHEQIPPSAYRKQRPGHPRHR